MHRLWRRSYLRRPLLLPPQRSAGIATVVEIVPEPSVTMAIMPCDYEDESHAVQRTEELLQSFTMFRSNPRNKRQRHVSSYCACTSYFVSSHAILVGRVCRTGSTNICSSPTGCPRTHVRSASRRHSMGTPPLGCWCCCVACWPSTRRCCLHL